MTIIDALRLYLTGGADDATGETATQLAGLTALRAITTAVYWIEMPRGTNPPCIVFSRINAARPMTADGPSGLANPRFQFTCVGTTQTQAETMAEALRKSLDGYRGVISEGAAPNTQTITVLGAFLADDADEPTTRADLETADLPAMRLDFTVWHRE